MKITDDKGNTLAVCYNVPNPNYRYVGEYKETELDHQKKQADILLTSIEGNWYTLWLQKPIEVKGRGVRRYSDSVVAVTESVYSKLEAKYNIMCDF